MKLHNTIIEIEAKPIIDKRNMWKIKDERRQYKNTDIIYDINGETHYSIGVGIKACLLGKTVLFTSVPN